MTLARVCLSRGRRETERGSTLSTLLTDGRGNSEGDLPPSVKVSFFAKLDTPCNREQLDDPLDTRCELASLSCEIETTRGSRDAQVNNVVLLSGILRARMVFGW